MDKRTIKKVVCLLTVWVFLLGQFTYAGIYEYEGIPNLPSSKGMPTYEDSSDWRNSKVEPLYNPEYQQIEPTLPPMDGGEGDSEPTGIWGWLVRNIGRPVKEHLIEPVVNFFKERIIKPAVGLMTIDRIDVSVELADYIEPTEEGSIGLKWYPIESVKWYYAPSKRPIRVVVSDALHPTEELRAYFEAEKAQGQKVSHVVIYDAFVLVNQPRDDLVVTAKSYIELKGEKGLTSIMPISGPGKVQLFDGKEVRGESIYSGTYQDAIRDIQNGLLTGVIDRGGKFIWRFYINP